ncbi:hypothetical protein CSIM01_10089 [Colletotrichum simmondsii]|uniref:Uncharacterized protein n=1 Tax=Colletotrichum simmondsii TaxID=703756 RepID=A0A135T4T7_9PEZI|nr:hypothetical protein CSIM01_10089 [Colletotrichum simmondsii]
MHDTPACIILTRTLEGFVRSEPWSLTYKPSWNLSRAPNIFAIHVQKDAEFPNPRYQRNFEEAFALTLALGWASSRQQPFAVLYGSERLVSSDRLLMIRNVLPGDFPDLVKDDLEWGSSHEETFEKALSSICTNPQFQATEVEFGTKKITYGQRGARMVKDYRATFRVELETHKDHDGVITYHASLSGKI